MKIIVSGLVVLFLLSAFMALSGCAVVKVATHCALNPSACN